MSKFKVGDEIRMVRKITPNKHRTNYIGLKGKVTQVHSPRAYAHGQAYSTDFTRPFVVYEDEIELATDRNEINITCTDNKTTHAVKKVDGKIVARSKAVCCPSDTFDFAVGANLAYDRLMRPETLEKAQPEQPKQEDKPKFKVGDRVIANGVITTKKFSGEVGTIKLAGTGNHFWVAFDEDVGGWGDSGYGIASGHGWTIPAANLEPYTEPESTEPKQEPVKLYCVAVRRVK